MSGDRLLAGGENLVIIASLEVSGSGNTVPSVVLVKSGA